MKHSKWIGFSIAALLAVLWAVPLTRAVSFLRWAEGYFSSDGTINALNDLRYSSWLLACYVACLFAAFVFAWIVARRPRFSFFLPGVVATYAVGEVIWLHPETPIHLFPIMTPWRPVIISLAALALGAFLFYVPRTSQNE